MKADNSSCPIVPSPDKQEGLGEGIAWWALPHPLDPAPCMKSTQPSMVNKLTGKIKTRPAVKQPVGEDVSDNAKVGVTQWTIENKRTKVFNYIKLNILMNGNELKNCIL